MKWIKRIVLLVVLLVIGGGIVVYLNLGRIVRRTVEVQSTSSLNLQTTVGGASLSIFGGKVSLDDLQIVSPSGYSAPKMLTLGGTEVEVAYDQLGKAPIHIKSLTLDKPTVVIEQANGKFNFQVLVDSLPKPPPGQEPMKLIIDDLRINNATVLIRANIPGLDPEIKVPVPSLAIKNVGNADGHANGAAVKDVVVQVMTSLAQQSGDLANLPDQLKASLKTSAGAALEQAKGELNKQVQGLTKELDKAVGPDAGKALEGLLNKKDPQKK